MIQAPEAVLLEQEIFSVAENNFEQLSIRVFQFQHKYNDVYRQYCDALRVDPNKIDCIEKIPFLPIVFFKTKMIKTGDFEPAVIFESSGTTGSVNSKHAVKELRLYKESFLKGYEKIYSDIKGTCILGLLPSYLERKNASLVYMVDEWIKQSAHAMSGFYLDDVESLYKTILRLEERKEPALLIGVTFALLDFADKFPVKLNYVRVMETGGMKGRREELIRHEVHSILKDRLGLDRVESEYGMTELLSQAYARSNGLFTAAPWMKILLREEDDPFAVRSNLQMDSNGSRGAINVIDLANIYSCSFIVTDDLARLYPTGEFEVLGRIDNSDLRGCGLMLL